MIVEPKINYQQPQSVLPALTSSHILHRAGLEVLEMKQIPLTQGKFAIVDNEDFKWLSRWKWYAKQVKDKWYAYRNVRLNTKNGCGQTLIAMHRIILNTLQGFYSDHRDGNGLNNQRDNLRVCSCSQNQANGSLRKDNQSGYRGVSWSQQVKKWRAQIKYQGKVIYLGAFRNKKIAANIYDQKANELFGEFARLNFS